MPRVRFGLLALLIGFLSLHPAPARAQDDGARLYMMVPDGLRIASVREHLLHSNLAVDPGVVSEDGDLETNLAVFQYVEAIRVAGGQSFYFLVLPVSRIEAEVALPGEDRAEAITGLGDAQLGFVLGVHGTPALSAADYAEHRPGLAVNLMGKIFFPTGRYSGDRSINIGANRFALRLGVPIVYAVGERMADPRLTTFELMPTVTFFGENDEPFEGQRTKQKPLFIVEGHLTHGFSKDFWASLDLLWRRGGEVEADGVEAGNSQRALSLGATGTFAVGPRASLRLSGGGVVSRNEHGPNGWMVRAILGFVL